MIAGVALLTLGIGLCALIAYLIATTTPETAFRAPTYPLAGSVVLRAAQDRQMTRWDRGPAPSGTRIAHLWMVYS